MVAQLRMVSGADVSAADDAPAAKTAPLWRHALMVLLGAAMLMTVIVANKRPTVFSDTHDYYYQANAIVRDAYNYAVHHKPIITHEMITDHWLHDENGDEEPIHNELGARSPYYGMFLWSLHHLGTIWLLAAVQATLLAGCIYALWRLAAPQAPAWTYPAAMAILAIGTPLPLIAGFAVPDALTGVAVLTGFMLLLYGDKINLLWKIAIWCLLAFSFNAHASHMLNALVLTLLAIGLLLAFKVEAKLLWQRGALILLAAVAAIAASSVYAVIMHLRTGDDLRSPPFLSIRVIADGPGHTYLKATCPKNPRWAMCKFKDVPPADSNTLMWSDDYKLGIFNVSEYPIRDRMEREDIPFALNVIMFDPLGETGAALKNWWLQFFSISLNEVLTDPYYYLHDAYWGRSVLRPLILGPGWCGHGPHACKPNFSEDVLRTVHWSFIAAALGFLGWRLSRTDVRHTFAKRNFTDPRTQALLVIVLLVAATIVNAAVCGMISGVFGRYQARIVWMIPLAAMLTYVAWGLRPHVRPHLEVVSGDRS